MAFDFTDLYGIHIDAVGPSLFGYKTADTPATVNGATYFNNATLANSGIKAGDIIFAQVDTGGTPTTAVIRVSAVDAAAGTVTAGDLNPLGHALFGSVAWDAGSIADGNEEVKEVTVTGAALGDFAIASLSLDVADLALVAAVTAADTVTCQLLNNTGGAVDLAAATVFVMVIPKRI